MSDSDLKEPPDDGGTATISKNAKRWYALYRVVQRSPPSSPGDRGSGDDESCCSALSVLASNLPGADEISLRISLAKKVAKGSLTPGGASLVSAITLGDSENEEAKYSIHSTILKPSWLENDSNQTDSSPKGFLVCYGSSVPQELESFQNEVDEHNGTLNGLLDDKLSGLASTITACLEEWNATAVSYVIRAIDILKHNLARALHATLINANTSFQGFSAEQENDVRNFMKACSIQWVDKPVPSHIAVSFSHDEKLGTSFEGIDSPIPFFCHHWAGSAHSAYDINRFNNAVTIKAVMEEYKLKVIQDVNNMRRLVQKANDDFYTLYKALIFLKHTGNASVIMRLLKDESICSDVITSSKSSHKVIDILEEFLDIK